MEAATVIMCLQTIHFYNSSCLYSALNLMWLMNKCLLCGHGAISYACMCVQMPP